MPRPGQLFVDGDDKQLGGAVYVERVVVQCEDGHGGGVGGEVKLHHERLLAVDSNLVCGGPGEEVVGGTLEESSQGWNCQWQQLWSSHSRISNDEGCPGVRR